MKNILSILLVSIILMGCSDYRPENGVLFDELTNKGSGEAPLMYYEDSLFTGVGFDVHTDGQIGYEVNYKDGKQDGLARRWHENGQLEQEGAWKDGELDGLWKYWDENGQLETEENYKDGKRID